MITKKKSFEFIRYEIQKLKNLGNEKLRKELAMTSGPQKAEITFRVQNKTR